MKEVKKVIKPQKIFFSYGHDVNSQIVELIKKDLEFRGHSIWIDKSQIRFGDDWRQKIVKGIMDTDSVLSFLSRHSVREPGVCLDELQISIGLKQGNIKTILLESENDVKPPASVSNIQWLDLSNWSKFNIESSEFKDWYKDKLEKIINVIESDEISNFTGEIDELKDKLNPYLSDSKYRYLLSKPYTRRLWLENILSSWMNKTDSKAFILIGSPGIGKSSFSAHTMHYNNNIISALFCEWDKPNSVESKSVIKTLAFNLAAKINDYRSLLINITNSNKFISEINTLSPGDLFDYLIINPISYLIDSNRENVYVLIDGLDEASDNNSVLAEILVENIKRMPKWVRFIITSRPENNIVNLFSSFNPLVVKQDNENNIQDIKNFLLLELKDYLIDKKDKLGIIDQILNNSEGSFLYASLFVEEIKNNPNILDEIFSYPRGLDQFYLLSFNRKFKNNNNYEVVKEVLEYIIVSENLPVNVIKDYLMIDSSKYMMFLKEMSSFIMKSFYSFDKHYKIESLTLIHKSLVDFLSNIEKSGDYYIDSNLGAKKLLDKYISVINTIDKNELYLLNYSDDVLPLKYIQDNIAYLFIKSKEWNKFNQFLVDSTTPLTPYFDFIELVPKYISLSSIAERLNNDSKKYIYLEKKRSEGKIELVKRLIQSLINKYGLDSLDEKIFYIYTDVLHLSGKYREAVELDENYLIKYPMNEIIQNETLLHIYTRMLHHSKFFCGTNELISKTQSMIKLIKNGPYKSEYAELLIMAANLGTLCGDINYSKECNNEVLKLSKDYKLTNYEYRAARKCADLLINDELYDRAIEFLLQYINPTNITKINRYQLYLLVSYGEAFALKNNFEIAYNIFKDALKIAKKRNIKGWIAHIYLSTGKLMMQYNHFNEALYNFNIAKEMYEEIEQEWGIINSVLLLCNLEIKMYQEVKSIDLLNEISDKIIKLEYNYYDKHLEEIKKNIYIEKFKLLFI